MKKTVAFLLAMLMLCLSLCACRDSGEDSLYLNGVSINEFFDAVEAEDYSGAAAMLHPNSELSQKDLKQYFEKIEENEKVDFQKGIKMDRYSNINSRNVCSVDVHLSIGWKKIVMHFEVLNDENGSGINQCYVVE